MTTASGRFTGRCTAMLRLCVALVLVANVTHAWAVGSANDWREDLSAMNARLREHHPAPWQEVGERAFQRQLKRIDRDLDAMDPAQRAVAVLRLFASLGDQGTAVELDHPDYGRWYPVRVYQFSDGYYLTSVHDSQRRLAGAKLLAAGGRSIDEVMDDVKKLMPSAGRGQVKERLFAFHNALLMQGLGIANPDGSLDIKLKLQSGKTVEHKLVPALSSSPFFKAGDSGWAWTDLTEVYGTPIDALDRWVSFNGQPANAFREPDVSRPYHLQRRRVFHDSYDRSRDVHYVQINAISDSRDETFDAFTSRILQQIGENKPRRVVLDFRLNGGGDGSKSLALTRKLVRLGDKLPWQELYIVVGRRTAGAALAVIVDIARHVPSTIIGEATGSPNMSTESQTFAYPGTGLKLHVSTRRAALIESDEWLQSLPLDIPVSWSFEDYRSGRDPAIDPILAGDEVRSLRVIALVEGGAAARRVAKQRRQVMASIEGWEEPRFDAIKRIGYDLLSANRAADAAEIFTLLTEQFPRHWNSWESLGVAQLALGQAESARSSNRCALRLDPENWDAAGLRKSLDEAPSGEAATYPATCPEK